MWEGYQDSGCRKAPIEAASGKRLSPPLWCLPCPSIGSDAPAPGLPSPSIPRDHRGVERGTRVWMSPQAFVERGFELSAEGIPVVSFHEYSKGESGFQRRQAHGLHADGPCVLCSRCDSLDVL